MGLKRSICPILGHFLVRRAPVLDAESALIRARSTILPPLSSFLFSNMGTSKPKAPAKPASGVPAPLEAADAPFPPADPEAAAQPSPNWPNPADAPPDAAAESEEDRG